MERERALFINRQENLSYLSDEYTRVYFGDEFCERLLPSGTVLRDVVDQVTGQGRDCTFVTPYVTEAGLEKVTSLLPLLPEATEVVINDWGVLRLLRRDFPHLVPVLGRLMTKIKRGPRIAAFLDKLPPDALNHMRSTNLGVPVYQQFLAKQGITRVELDNPLQGLNLSEIPENIHLSIHIPFAYVSTTRFCLTANVDKPEKKGMIGVFPCGKECQKYTFFLDNAVMTRLLIRRGNTVFFQNTDVPNEIRDSVHIDRVIISPEIPH
ncbi:MAG: hypothetical protein GY868_12285 [Deltaproteobacteria bacterium]|nr:hypothetical protein [Deltaproteobacteria bacterium]